MKKMLLIGLTSALTATAGIASAQVKPFEAIEYRQGVFKAVKWHFGPLGDMVKGKTEFNAEEFSRRANLLAALSQMPGEAFLPGTYDKKTGALPNIETERAKFDEGMQNFQTATAELATAAKSGDMNSIRPAFMAAAKTCKACHDNFRD